MDFHLLLEVTVSVLVKDSIIFYEVHFFLNVGELFCVLVKYSSDVLGH